MPESISTTTKPRAFKMAYLLDDDGLRQLDRLLKEEVLKDAESPGGYEDAFKKVVDYRVDFSDKSNLQTNSVDEVAALPNSKDRRITAITINTPYWNRDLHARVNFRSSSYFEPVEYEVSGEAKATLHLADVLDQHFLAFRQWYTPISRFSFLFAAAVLFTLIFVIAQVLKLVYGLESDSSPDLSSSLFIVMVIYAVLGLLHLLRSRLFPVATFAIGQGVARNRRLNFWRGTVLVGLLLSVAGSLLVEFILSLVSPN